MEAVGLKIEGEAAELALETLLLGLELPRGVVRLVIFEAQVDELLGDLVDDPFALLLECLPVDAYNV